MCKATKIIQIMSVIIILTTVSIHCKRKRNKYDLENDVLEKSEVTLKVPMYALHMPPILTSRKRTNAKVNPEPISCTSSNVTKSLNELRKKIRCVPRDAVVTVTSPEGSKVIPNTVVVKRCGGMCSGEKRCLPVPGKITNIEFQVKTTSPKTPMFCSRIFVPEHTECTCDCPEKKRCSVDQKFDPTLCKCLCTNKEEEHECKNMSDLNFKWSAKTCSCGCKKERMCTTGTMWSKEKCKCMKT